MSRFEQAMHYVVANTKPDELGKTKLAKVLFYADLEAYRRTGRTITTAIYEKRTHGPMPKGFYAAIDNLERAHKIAQRKDDHFGRLQHQFWATEEPELLDLTARDVSILSYVTRDICDNHTATSISELSHNVAWEVAEDGEEIPLAAFIVADSLGQPTASEIAQIEAVLGARN